MNTSYLIIPATRRAEAWLRMLLSLMSANYRADGARTVQPVLVGLPAYNEDPSASDRMQELCRHYRLTRQHTLPTGMSLCQTPLLQPLVVAPAAGSDELMPREWPGQAGQALRTQTMLMGTFESLLKPHFDEGDRVVVAVQADEHCQQMAVAEAAAACFAEDGGPDALTLVCEVPFTSILNGRVKGEPASVIDHLRQLCATVVTGLHRAPHRQTVTQLHTAIALADALHARVEGEPAARGDGTDVVDGMANLPTPLAADALTRLMALRQLHHDSLSPTLSTWLKRLRMDDARRLWTGNDLFASLQQQLADAGQWMDAVPEAEFRLQIDRRRYQDHLLLLNKTTQLKATSTQEERRREALRTMVQTAESMAEGMQYGGQGAAYTPARSDYSLQGDWLFGLHHLQQGLTATAWFDATDKAFDEAFLSSGPAKVLRSLVLDVWQLFFSHDKVAIERALRVSEFRLSQACTPRMQRLLRQTDTGRLLLEADLCYSVAARQGTFAAVSSPLTGFCVSTPAPTAVSVADAIYFSTETPRELNERPDPFRQFVFLYTAMRPDKFSPRFRAYIDQAISDRKADYQAMLPDVVRTYDRFRRHVGIDIETNNP